MVVEPWARTSLQGKGISKDGTTGKLIDPAKYTLSANLLGF